MTDIVEMDARESGVRRPGGPSAPVLSRVLAVALVARSWFCLRARTARFRSHAALYRWPREQQPRHEGVSCAAVIFKVPMRLTILAKTACVGVDISRNACGWLFRESSFNPVFHRLW